NTDKANVEFKFYGVRGHYSETEYLKLLLLKNYIYNILMERLRNKEGGVYGVRTNFYELPPFEYGINVSFTTMPGNAAKLIDAVKEEIRELQEKGPKDSLLDTSKNLVGEGELNTNNRSWFSWQSYLVEQYRNKRDPRDVLKRSSILAGLTAKDIQDAAKKYLDFDHAQLFILTPGTKRAF
ncbi:MAG TPA: insulinase family protein, partial [Chitinophagaceae bacterium]|nr:insulinase family protein [Chitinophagaceae bacterium]